MSYRKIVQIGASGNVGAPVFDALVASGKFEVTAVARHTSTFTAPEASASVIKVDFSNHQMLVEALKGNDAIAITMGDSLNLDKNSKLIIDAAIEAGVKRIIPSEYGGDLVNSPGREMIVYTSKHKVVDYLVEKAAKGLIEYTTIATGPFFDWGLTHYQFVGFDIPFRKATIYNGGNGQFNTSTMATVGAAVVSVFSTPAKFKNSHLRISDFFVSQNEILTALEAQTGSKFAIEEVDADKLQDESSRGLSKGEWNQANVFGSVTASVFASKSASRWGEDDARESLGIAKKDLEEEIRKVL